MLYPQVGSRKLRAHERAFRKNPWHYARGVCSTKAKSEDLACSVEEAYTYFAGCAEDGGKYSGQPEWVSNVMQPPSEDEVLDFDLSPVTPAIVKRVLRSRPSGSSPGEDGITYHHLKMLPSTHHFLATLFSKLLHSQLPPASWCHAKILTAHKKGYTKDPLNFRPIALTSVVAKLFHKILAMRLEEYFIQNSIIDKSLQNDFLRG